MGGAVGLLMSGVVKHYFMYAFGALALVSTVLCVFLKETKGQLMADTAEQARINSEVESAFRNGSLSKFERVNSERIEDPNPEEK